MGNREPKFLFSLKRSTPVDVFKVRTTFLHSLISLFNLFLTCSTVNIEALEHVLPSVPVNLSVACCIHRFFFGSF